MGAQPAGAAELPGRQPSRPASEPGRCCRQALPRGQEDPTRVLILTQHFVPEITAARVRMQAFAEGLSARGHEVDVVCAVPNHPQGIVREGYRRRAVVREARDGYRVHYVWVHPSPRKTPARRMLLYGTYAASATAVASALPRPDVILATSPPLPTGAAAAAVAARHRVPWVLDVRDLWPEAAVILGEIPDGRLAAAAGVLERALYRSAAEIVTATEPFRDDIAASGADPAKISVIMNGTTQEWIDAGLAEPDRAQAGLHGSAFVWAYAGNLGIAQGLDTAIDAAELLGPGYRLLLIGDGPKRAELEQHAARLAAGQVEFRGLVQPQLAASLLRSADALLVPLAGLPELRKFVPSKLFDCCAIGRPVIVSAAGESQRLVAESDAGVAVPPADPEALAEAVRRLHGDPELGRRLAERGRSFARRHLREAQAQALEDILGRAVSRRR